MGADLITIGYTVDGAKLKDLPPSRLGGVEDDATWAIIDTFLEEIRGQLNKIDYNEYLDALETDERGFSADGEDVLANVLHNGWDTTVNNYRNEDSYRIPNSDNVFIIAGGTSWGDDPFEGYTDLVLLIAAVDQIPALGAAIGILGSGIRL